jgi:hypothetical protein
MNTATIAQGRPREMMKQVSKIAMALARDLKHGVVMPGWNWTGWFVTIADLHGHKVDEVPIMDV